MTQPKFAPVRAEDEVRPSLRLAVPPPWTPHRPADYAPSPSSPHVRSTGYRGPDQGYALLLAQRFAERLVLGPGERVADVLAAATAIALRRASLFGRAPVAADVEVALTLFGWLDTAPSDLVAYRRELVAGAAHDYWRQREVADSVPEEALRRPLQAVRSGLSDWRALLGLAAA